MSYSFYKILHILGVLAVFMSLGAIALHAMNGGDKKFANRKWTMIFHGMGIVFILVSGFGLLARIGVTQGGLPGWIYAKLFIWLILSGIIAAIPRMQNSAKILWIIVLSLGTLGGYLANYKPF